MINQETREVVDLSLIDPVIEEKKGVEGALIPLLQCAQELYGYLPESVLQCIHDRTGIPLCQIYGVVTFYVQFYLKPKGRNTVRVCRGTACHVRGAKSVLKTTEQILGIQEGETGVDLKFSLETVACLGACAMGPVMVVNKTYFGKMTPKRVETILNQYD
jgi:NADH-quinone oxidoreductase subunit E